MKEAARAWLADVENVLERDLVDVVGGGLCFRDSVAKACQAQCAATECDIERAQMHPWCTWENVCMRMEEVLQDHTGELAACTGGCGTAQSGHFFASTRADVEQEQLKSSEARRVHNNGYVDHDYWSDMWISAKATAVGLKRPVHILLVKRPFFLTFSQSLGNKHPTLTTMTPGFPELNAVNGAVAADDVCLLYNQLFADPATNQAIQWVAGVVDRGNHFAALVPKNV